MAQPEQHGAASQAALADPKAALPAVRAQAAAAVAAGASGLAVCAQLSDFFDDVLKARFGPKWARVGAGISVLAQGGWGRREMCPYSDMDLLFLVPAGQQDAAAALADEVLYPLWDARFPVGHSVRTLDDALELAGSDLPTATALLDARLILGPAEPLAELSRRLVHRLIHTRRPNEFVERLLEERRERHERFGASATVLEPNLKLGEGTLRDICLASWAAKARYRVHGLDELVARGHASARQIRALQEAREFLLRLRVSVQVEAARRTDQLSFELQETLGPRFFPDAAPAPGAIRAAVAPAVEALMRQYYLHAKTVARESMRLLERAIVPPPERPRIRHLDRSFTLWNGQLSMRDPAILRDRPSEIVRLFRVASAEKLRIYGHTKDLVAELMPECSARLVDDADARRWFLELLADPSDARSPTLMEELHDLGGVAALVPEFGPCTGRMQHDLYHVYTVDQHQLYTLAYLKRIARKELAADAPGPTRAMDEVERPAPLYLACLLHDVGKPLGKGHSESGARIAEKVGLRLGLSPADAAQAGFLVRHHLLMSRLSQRRDLSDPLLAAGLADSMRDVESLRQLYLLTFCDTSMTAPGNMTSWKSSLLDELYEQTRRHLQGGAEQAGEDAAGLVAERRRRAAELMGEIAADGAPDPALGAWCDGLEDRYFLQSEPQSIVQHLKLSRLRGARPIVSGVTGIPRQGVVELHVVAEDRAGLLASLTGVFFLHGLDVVSARIHTRRGIGQTPEALDVFKLRRQLGGLTSDDPVFERLGVDLERALDGRLDVAARVDAKRKGGGLPVKITPQVVTQVEVDGDASERFTVLEVSTEDRPGILYQIARILGDAGLDIAFSKVGHEGNKVTDVFYLSARASGSKVPPEALDPVRHALLAALAGGAR